MTITATLREFVRDLLPDGPFWRGQPADRFVTATADAWANTANFVALLRDHIHPDAADRAVLLQWWDYLRSTDSCVATPSDTEDLRARVLGLLGAIGVDTPAGLEAIIHSYLPYVDVAESLPVSTLPQSVPFPLDPSGRILEVWHSPLINSDEQVRCVVSLFQRAGDALRLITPVSALRAMGPDASEVALSWTYQRAATGTFTLLDESLNVEEVVTMAVSEQAVETADQLFNSATNVGGYTIRASFSRAFADGAQVIHVASYEVDV